MVMGLQNPRTRVRVQTSTLDTIAFVAADSRWQEIEKKRYCKINKFQKKGKWNEEWMTDYSSYGVKLAKLAYRIDTTVSRFPSSRSVALASHLQSPIAANFARLKEIWSNQTKKIYTD